MSNVEDVQKFYKKIFHIIGIWPDPKLSKWHRRGAIFAFLTLLVFPTILCILSLKQAKNVEEFAVSVMFIGVYGLTICALTFFTVNRLKIEGFINGLFKAVYEETEGASFADKAHAKALKFSKITAFLTTCIVSLTTVTLPLFFGSLPAPVLIPNWAESKLCFIFLSILQFLSFNYMNMSLHTILYSFVILMICNGYGEFLSARLSMLVSSKYHDGYQDLVKCILAHQKLQKMLNDFKTHLSFTIGLLYKISIIMIGVSILVITKGENQLTFQENFPFYFYMGVPVAYIFIPSYIGNLIHSQSSKFLYDLFSSDWINADLKYKKAMIIFMENLKKPIELKVLFYDSLNLNVFQNAVSEGYSMFSIFKNLKNTVEA